MWFDREISDKILRLASQFPAVVLTGARQTGKTSLLQQLFSSHSYVSLDIPSLAAQAEESPQDFLEQFKPPILVDEVQYAPKLFRHLKVAIDKDRHKMGQFILTGSQKFTLMKEVSDSLAGRCAVLELETLSTGETGKCGPDLVPTIVRGGFPDLWRDPSIDSTTFYHSYLTTYLERDVRQLVNVVSLRDFERFIRVCASRSGQVLEKTAIAGEVGVKSKTINEWISVLVASNQIAILEPWFGNFGKRLVKSPKMYFCDTGFASYLLGVDSNSLVSSPFLGAIWETFVYSEIRKALNKSSKPRSVWYYRDNEQREIDFLVLGGGKNLAIECKWHEIPSTQDAQSIIELSRYLEQHPRPELEGLRGLVLCRTPHKHPLRDGSVGINLDQLRDLLDDSAPPS